MSTLLKRLRKAYAALDRDQRFAAVAAIGLLVAMFLPWYEKNVVVAGSKQFVSDSISAFGAVSFVEAAIFLVAAGVLALLLARADERPFHLPGGDGTVIFAAGLWASALIFYRVFDRPNVSGEGGTVGIQWGFFVAFVAAGALAFAGQRIRVAGRPEPRLPAADPDPSPAPAPGSPEARSRARARSLVRDDVQTEVVPRSDAQTEVVTRPPDRAVTREDARRLTFEPPQEDEFADDDEPPLRPGEIPRSRDGA
ncbi:MAG: hypothetical protein QOG42_389 [Solirubrobacteraceae bacterium]|nr:hypothetical protein [Solirubrobacteraceae bacterium]